MTVAPTATSSSRTRESSSLTTMASPSPPSEPPPTLPTLEETSSSSSMFVTITSLFGAPVPVQPSMGETSLFTAPVPVQPSMGESVTNGVINPRPGFIYKNKPAPAPPVPVKNNQGSSGTNGNLESRFFSSGRDVSAESVCGSKVSNSGPNVSNSGSNVSNSGSKVSAGPISTDPPNLDFLKELERQLSNLNTSTNSTRNATNSTRNETNSTRNETNSTRNETNGARNATNGARNATNGARNATNGARNDGLGDTLPRAEPSTKVKLASSGGGIPTIKPPPASGASRNRSHYSSTALFSSSSNSPSHQPGSQSTSQPGGGASKQSILQLVPQPPSQASSNQAPFSTTTKVFNVFGGSSSKTPSAPTREVVYGLADVANSSAKSTARFLGSKSNSSKSTEASMIDTLMSKVGSASSEDCKTALYQNNMDLVSSLKDLQINQLLRLGIGDRLQVESSLRANDWNMEAAASALLDKS